MATVSSYQSEIQTASQQYGVPASIIAGVMQNEGNLANSPTAGNGGGIGQFEPSTWSGLGGGNVHDATTNINHMAKYLSELHAQTGSWSLAVGSYYAGPQSVLSHKNNLNYIPSPQSGNSLTVASYIQNALGSSSSSSNPSGASTAGFNLFNMGIGTGLASSLFSGLTNPIVRVGYIFIGVIFIIVGGFLMVKDTDTFKTAQKVAIKGAEM